MAVVPPRDPESRAEWRARLAQQEQTERSGIARVPSAAQGVGTRTFIPRVAVIMVNFADTKLQETTTPALVDSMFNGQNWTADGATGSVRQYFYDQSMGLYNPQFDIYGPITLSKGYAEYGKSSSAAAMVKEACKNADDMIDFAQYDSDNDGKVDLVYVFFAGFGENDITYLIENKLVPDPENLVWPQYIGNTSGGTYDGKSVSACEYSNELDGMLSTAEQNVLAGIGVPCHEFCHALGLPDMYSNAHDGKLLGEWDIMCDGPYNNLAHTPPSFSAYERFFMGWMTPTLITGQEYLTLENIATSNKAFLITGSDTHNMNGLDPDPTIYYLLENRQENMQQQGWDVEIPGSGMLITRIHHQPSLWPNNINSQLGNLSVDIIEADGLTPDYNPLDRNNGYFGKPGDAFPYGATEYLGITDHPITNISMKNGIVRFSYRGADVPTMVTPDVMSVTATKTMFNGQLLIQANGHTYTVFGIQQD